jgi:serine/threonine protein kinase
MEFCETDLRKILTNKNRSLTFEERKRIAIGTQRGYECLQHFRIRHRDMKAENILMKDGIPKLSDFGLIIEESGKESYRQMGYARRGSKHRDEKYLC